MCTAPKPPVGKRGEILISKGTTSGGETALGWRLLFDAMAGLASSSRFWMPASTTAAACSHIAPVERATAQLHRFLTLVGLSTLTTTRIGRLPDPT